MRVGRPLVGREELEQVQQQPLLDRLAQALNLGDPGELLLDHLVELEALPLQFLVQRAIEGGPAPQPLRVVGLLPHPGQQDLERGGDRRFLLGLGVRQRVEQAVAHEIGQGRLTRFHTVAIGADDQTEMVRRPFDRLDHPGTIQRVEHLGLDVEIRRLADLVELGEPLLAETEDQPALRPLGAAWE